jgi:hypothetical protein
MGFPKIEEYELTASDRWHLYKKWMRQNLTLLIGILIIFSMVWYNAATVDSKISKSINECNEHWHGQVQKACPELYGDGMNYISVVEEE